MKHLDVEFSSKRFSSVVNVFTVPRTFRFCGVGGGRGEVRERGSHHVRKFRNSLCLQTQRPTLGPKVAVTLGDLRRL